MAEEKGWTVGAGKALKETEKKHVYKEIENFNWLSHPLNEKVKMMYLLTKRDDNVDVTIFLGRTPKGTEVPEHTHEVNDIMFPLSGRGKIWIDGLGELELKRGVLVNIPANTRHRVFDITEDMDVYGVWIPATV